MAKPYYTHPDSTHDAEGIPGTVHGIADLMVQWSVGALVALVTKNPYVAIGAAQASPTIAHMYEGILLGSPNTFGPPITSTNRTLSRGGKNRVHSRKQISSTSHYNSRRKKYDYGKRKRYNRY